MNYVGIMDTKPENGETDPLPKNGGRDPIPENAMRYHTEVKGTGSCSCFSSLLCYLKEENSI
jgi:hypothetical protein